MANTTEQLQEAEPILADVDAGTELQGCLEIAGSLAKAQELLEAAGQSEHARQLDQDRLACLIVVYSTITGSGEQRNRITGFAGYSDGSTFPDPDAFSPETMQYFQDRAEQVSNPVLKARYSDLLWEKSSLNRGQKYQYALRAIEAYLESARRFATSPELSHQLEMISAFDQAMHLSIAIANKDLLARTVKAIIALIDERERDESNREEASSERWTLELCVLLLYVKRQRRFRDLVDEATLTQVQEVADRLSVHFSQKGEYQGQRSFLDVATEAATLRSDAAAVYTLQLRKAQSWATEAQVNEQRQRYIAAAASYEDAVEHFEKMRDSIAMISEQRSNLASRAADLKQKIREMYRLGRNEKYYSLEHPISISADDLEPLLTNILSPQTLNDTLKRIASEGSLLPNVSLAEEQAKDAFGKSVLSLIPMRSLRDDMAIAEFTTDEERLKNAIDHNLLIYIELKSNFLLTTLFTRLREQRGLNAENLLEYFDAWGLIEEDNREFIRIGIERYFAGDFVSALHILVPQFEDVLRTVFEKVGEPPIKRRKGQAGWEMETFGAFLKRPLVESVLAREIREYIRLVMTEPTGWNLRNRIAHGLIEPRYCARYVADTVLHLFLILTLIHISREMPERGPAS